MNKGQAIAVLDKAVQNPSKGLPEEVFLFASRITPMINVDLLIKDRRGRTLLTWRDDGHWPAGWHIPGGIIRYKETIEKRIHAVAKGELKATVSFTKTPLAVTEFISRDRRNRGHFISLLYACKLTSPLSKRLKYDGIHLKHCLWAWHEGCPDNLLSSHEVYRHFIVN